MYGKLLGEIYRIQRRLDVEFKSDKSHQLCKADDKTIYGLLEGIEEAINPEIEGDLVSQKDSQAIVSLFHKHLDNLDQLKGYYTNFEPELQKQGIGRDTFLRVAYYLRFFEMYNPILDGIDTNDSPGECRKITKPDDFL